MKTTKKQFELFKKECHRWADRFELSEWRLDLGLSSKVRADTLADINRHLENRVITVRLNSNISKLKDESWEDLLKETAKHEMIHALLGATAILAKCRYVQEDELRAAEEGLVRKLEKLIINQ